MERNVYLVRNVDLDYLCDVCSSMKYAKQCLEYYTKVISRGKYKYEIVSKPLTNCDIYDSLLKMFEKGKFFAKLLDY